MPIKLVNIFFATKYFSSNMKRHIIYLATDANRINIEVGYCNNIIEQLFPLHIELKRMVYMEEFHSFEEAQKRKLALYTYTRMMKERIIRKHNPNWLNIATTVTGLHTPKKVVAHVF